MWHFYIDVYDIYAYTYYTKYKHIMLQPLSTNVVNAVNKASDMYLGF